MTVLPCTPALDARLAMTGQSGLHWHMTAAPTSQQEVLAVLARPATHGGLEVRRIDTHAASVFLAGDRALKIKRAVRLPFLDYSTLAKRKRACEIELAANAPFAPQIYRGVVPVTREASGKLAIGGPGLAVEWAVDMRRFDEARTLDRLADRERPRSVIGAGFIPAPTPSKIDEALAEALGRAVAQAHGRAPAAHPQVTQAAIAALPDYIDEHFKAFRQHPELFAAAAIDALAERSRSAYRRIQPLLLANSRRGPVRRLHGDLHLGNIVLIDAEPALFDAIEFSDIVACGAVFYDLAFLLLDLLERRLTRAANIVLNRYLAQRQRLEDLDALATLPFFLSMRAAIRARVNVARLERAPGPQRPAFAHAARAYFDFALRAIAPPAPERYAIGPLDSWTPLDAAGAFEDILARARAALPPSDTS
jgi:aminoglycoside phosphotransferase family enzyme